MNKKALFITSSIVIPIILMISWLYMMSPLQMLYSSSKYGDFVVTSSLPNKFSYRATITSNYDVAAWRLQCLYKVNPFLSKEDVQPKIIFNTTDKSISLNAKIEENKPIEMYLDIKDKKGYNAFKYYKVKRLTKKILDKGELKLNPVFLKDDTEEFAKVYNACNSIL